MAALHVEAAAEGSALLQHAAGFPVGGFFIWKSVKAVEGQHDIKAFIFIRQCAHVSLLEGIFFSPNAFAFSRAEFIMFSE